MARRPTRKVTAAVLMCTLAATALSGGTLAQLTDRDTTTPQVVRAGTFVANIEQGANWGQDLHNLAVGDTADRVITLVNGSTRGISKITLFADITSTPGPGDGDLSEVVTVDIVQDDTTTIANDVALADLADGYDLTFTDSNLPADGEAALRFTYTVTGTGSGAGSGAGGVNPDNAYQSSALNIRYTINAVFNTADGPESVTVDAPEDVVVTFDGDTAMISFTEPVTNPSGTVYTVYPVEEPANTSSGIASPLTLTGLERGTTYQFAVTAAAPGGTVSEPTLSEPVETPVAGRLVPYVGRLTGWGASNYGQLAFPADLGNVVSVDAAVNPTRFAVAAKENGTVAMWGSFPNGAVGTVPPGLTDVIQVSTATVNTLALKRDGTVVAWGSDPIARQVPPGLQDVVQVEAAGGASLALLENGTVVQWGFLGNGTTQTPADLTDVVQITSYGGNVMALKSDGSVVTWGGNVGPIPAAATNIVAIAADTGHLMALRKDGTVVAWGADHYQHVSGPMSARNVKAIAAGAHTSFVIYEDGTSQAWGPTPEKTIPASVVNPIRLLAVYQAGYAVLPLGS